MKRIIFPIYVIFYTITFCRTEVLLSEIKGTPQVDDVLQKEEVQNEEVTQKDDITQKGDNSQKADVLEKVDVANFIEETITIIENSVKKAAKVVREDIVPIEEIDQYFADTVDLIEDLIEIIKEPTRAYIFLKAKGIERVIIPNMNVQYAKLRMVVLTLLKVLFEQVPTTTEAVIPISTIDKLVDVFENDDSLGVKAHALDILSKWLPGNPKAQVRIIKMKGLAPFYQPISDLNGGVISKLLNLFNMIIEEHIKVRTEKKQRNKVDSDKYIMYQRMGLLEHLSTRKVCDGLLNIFYITFSHTKDYDVTAPVYKLIKNIMPYCTKVQTRQERAIKFFEGMLEHVKTQGLADLQRYDLNVTDIKSVLQDYVRIIKEHHLPKDEF